VLNGNEVIASSAPEDGHMNPSVRMQWVAGVFGALVAMIAAGCTAQGVSQSALNTLESDKQALQQQLAAMAPTMVVQAGPLAPSPAAGDVRLQSVRDTHAIRG
jgi:hypothetical protein